MLWGDAELDFAVRFAGLDQGGTGAPSRVADLGCGDGLLGRLLLRRFPKARVDGYDLDEDTVLRARALAAEDGLQGRLTFTVADAGDLDVRGGYDAVVAQAVLVHQSAPIRVLREALSLLRPGGSALFVEPDVGAAHAIFDPPPPGAPDPWPAIVRGAQAAGAGDWQVADGMSELLCEAGFLEVRAARHPGRYAIPSPTGALEAHLRDLDPENEAAHLDVLAWLHAAGDGESPAWASYREALEAQRVARGRSIAAATYRLDAWGALHLATATKGWV